ADGHHCLIGHCLPEGKVVYGSDANEVGLEELLTLDAEIDTLLRDIENEHLHDLLEIHDANAQNSTIDGVFYPDLFRRLIGFDLVKFAKKEGLTLPEERKEVEQDK